MLHNSKKFDGSIHYRFPAIEIVKNDNYLVLYLAAHTEMESYRGKIPSLHHLLEVFYPDCFHNDLLLWYPDWTPKKHYVNIATPAEWDNALVTCIDLDIDIIRGYGSNEIIIADRDEFEQHKTKYNYPESLIKTIEKEIIMVKKLMKKRKGIFSDKAFAWRPGKKLPFVL